MAIAPAATPTVEASISSEHTAESSAAAFKRLHPAPYLSRYLSKGYRPDGRKEREWRDVKINTGSISTADGSALVRVGDTTVVCGIKAEIAEPSASRPDEGYIIPNIDLPAICSPSFKPGPPSDEAQTMSNWLYDLMTSSETIDPSTLCICPGKAVWALYIDVVCINYDGNAFDTSVLAVMAALRNTRLPRATYDDNTAKATCKRGEKYPLSLGRIPLACSFGIFKSSYLLSDPDAFESPLLSTTITIALDEKGRGCLVRQEGLGGTNQVAGSGLLLEAWSVAEHRIQEFRKILESS